MSRKSKRALNKRNRAAVTPAPEAQTALKEVEITEAAPIIPDDLTPEEEPTTEAPDTAEEPAIPEEPAMPKARWTLPALPIKFTLPENKNLPPELSKVLRLGGMLALLCLLSLGLLTWVHHATQGVLAKHQAQAALEAEILVPGADALTQILPSDGSRLPVPLEGVWEARTGTETVGWRVQIAPEGFVAPITVQVGIGLDGAVTGIRILEISETPGFGDAANDPDWLGQFIGLTGPLSLTLTDKANPQEIAAVSGATVTSAALVDGVQAALDYVRTLMGGAQ